jgi:cell wall-associated NlpC family hydrolase
MMAAASIGVLMEHGSAGQFNIPQAPRVTAPYQPGDYMYFYGGEPPGSDRPGHVGIYVSENRMISAFDEQMGVCYTTFVPDIDRTSNNPLAFWGATRPALWGKSLPHPTEPTLFYTVPNMTGSSVVLCQNRLVLYGFKSVLAYAGCSGGVDGVFGSRTRLAVEYFQMKEELVTDGIVGVLTWGALLKKPHNLGSEAQ